MEGVGHMKFVIGFSRRAVEANTKEYIANGYEPGRAAELARNLSRKYFLKKKPGEELPGYLKEAE